MSNRLKEYREELCREMAEVIGQAVAAELCMPFNPKARDSSYSYAEARQDHAVWVTAERTATKRLN